MGWGRGVRRVGSKGEERSTGNGPWHTRFPQAACGTWCNAHTAVIRGAGEAAKWAGGPVQQWPFSVNQIFSNPFKFDTVKDGLLVLKNFHIKFGRVDNWRRNNFSHWSFSKFRMEFELKIREPIWAKFDWIWILGTWKLQNLSEFGMWAHNCT
jgi:hypothetical protein